MKQKSIKLNFIMNAVLTMSNFIFPLITFPYVSRVLLAVGTGKVAFATSVVSYFSMFAQLGIPTYGIRACAKIRDDREKLSRTVQELLIINVTMCVIMYVLFFAALFTVPRLREEKTLFLITGTMILFNTIGMEWLYRGLEEYSYITVRSIVFKFISVAAMFMLVRSRSDYYIYGGVTIFASSASSVFNLIHSHKYITLKPLGSYNIKRHLKPIMVFFAMSCATTVYTNLDTVMLGFMKTDTDVGYYNASIKIKSILVSIITSLGTVLLPRASYYIEQRMFDEFKDISRKAIHFVSIAALPIMIYFMIFAREGICFLSGDGYEGSILPMQILMPTLFFIGLTNIMGIQIMVPLGREKHVLYSVIVGAIVDVIINLTLIPGMASAGAAIGTTVAEFAVLVYQIWRLRGDDFELYRNIKYVRIIFAIALSAAASLVIKQLELGVFLKLIISAAVYFGIYLMAMLIMKDELISEITSQSLSRIKKLRK